MRKILENLIKEGLLQEEKGIGADQLKKRITRAATDLRNAKLILADDSVGAYRAAYDSMLQAGIALILSLGYRPKVSGFHKTVVECAKEILVDDFSVLTRKFDQMRKNRHEAIYEAVIISKSEAEEAIVSAKKLVKEVSNYLKEKNPQKELFN